MLGAAPFSKRPEMNGSAARLAPPLSPLAVSGGLLNKEEQLSEWIDERSPLVKSHP